jgi:sugar-specific transcriptional regulator TrmB
MENMKTNSVEELKKQIEDLKEDLRDADMYYINCSDKLLAAEKEIDELKQRLKDIKEGFEGCCYACEPVGMLNQELEAQLKAIYEDGTEEHNAAVDLRSNLAQSRLETDEWKKAARHLYSVALHLKAIANSGNSIIVVGNGLYTEAHDAITEYEKLQNL